MSILKPVPVIPQVVRNLCPVCGKPSYSRDGIHPQCSLFRADAARNAKIREKRKLEKKVEKPKQSTFSKMCPKCRTTVHARLAVCACGHSFSNSRF